MAGAHGTNRAQGNASANLAPAFTADTAAQRLSPLVHWISAFATTQRLPQA